MEEQYFTELYPKEMNAYVDYFLEMGPIQMFRMQVERQLYMLPLRKSKPL